MCRILTKGQNNVFSLKKIASRSEAIKINYASICGVNVENDNYVLVTGGNMAGRAIAICQRYDVDFDYWQDMKKMHQPRYHHSSCQLAEHIYVFCGLNN